MHKKSKHIFIAAGFSILAVTLTLFGQTITLNGTGTGRIFDGIGALSAGASSRLLIDYPEPQRTQILDYLFKPNYGASLQILKVEIGGDCNSTDGSEPSHQHSRTEENYHRGYEWWLMEEAKKRNPKIHFSALEWGSPGWIGPSNHWSQDNIDYIINFIKHAKSDHGIDIGSVGGWNERGYNKAWMINLKKALIANGLNTLVVGSDDGGWGVSKDIPSDTAFANAMDIAGTHYGCGNCAVPVGLINWGKRLWDNEEGTSHYNTGANGIAMANNRAYISGKMTAVINWSLIWSAYAALPYNGTGLMLANTPWSGYFEVGRSIWADAHTNQFAERGWKYLDDACTFIQGNSANGSLVSLVSPNGLDYSIILQTLEAGVDQTVTFQTSGGLSTGPIHVWSSNFGSSNLANYFLKEVADIQPLNGKFTYTFKKGYVYSLTTTTGQAKGEAVAPPQGNFPFPHYDHFDQYAPGRQSRFFSDQDGSFDPMPCQGGRAGGCLEQMVTQKPNLWYPYTGYISLIGDPNWTDYQVVVDVLQAQSGYIDLWGRVSDRNPFNNLGPTRPTGVKGYYLHLDDQGTWNLFREELRTNANLTAFDTTLASGKVSLQLNSWHQIKLVFHGSQIEAWVDSIRVANVVDGFYKRGMPGIGTKAFQSVQFDNFGVAGWNAVPIVKSKEYGHSVLFPKRIVFVTKSGTVQFVSPTSGSDAKARRVDTHGRTQSMDERE